MGTGQLARTLRLRWKAVLFTLLLGMVGAGAITAAVVTPTYRSDARVFVTGTSVSSVPANLLDLYSQQQIASYADLATDPAVLKSVIRSVGLPGSYQDLAPNVSATVDASGKVLQISATYSDPHVAQRIAEADAAEIVKLVKSLGSRQEAKKESSGAVQPPLVASLGGGATFDSIPVSPNLPLNVIIGALLGLLFGIVGAILRDFLDTTIDSPEGASKASGAPVMAVIPFDSKVFKRPLFSGNGDSSDWDSAFEVLRTNLQFVDLDSQRQMIVVSSALPDEGKTVTSINLALALAKTSRRVLIVDCDFRNSGVARGLGLENSVGLLSVLVGHGSLEDCIQQHSSGCDLLATGPLPPNPAEVLQTQAMTDLLARMRGLYDVVIIDAPPLLPVVDPAILASKADGVLLVVRHGKTSVDAVENAVKRISAAGGRVLGVVLNRSPRVSNFRSRRLRAADRH